MGLQSLQGKVGLITGGGRGIGRSIAEAYAAQGMKVVVSSRSREQLDETVAAIRQAGGEATGVAADVTDHGQVQAMVQQAVDTYGGLDLILINAGGSLDRKPIAEGNPVDWVGTVDLNLIAAYYCAREAIPHLKARGAGKILTMGSGAGHKGFPGNSSYAVAKAGLWMLVRVLAQELAADNISVNEIIPGPVKTYLTREQHGEGSGGTPRGPFAVSGEWVKEPEDVVDLALFLARQPDVGPTAQSYSLMRRDT